MADIKDTNSLGFATKGARSVPIYQTISYVFDNCNHAVARFALEEPGNIYGRLTNPTQETFEKRMSAIYLL